MNKDLKSLFLNIIAGIITFYVANYFDDNNLPMIKYSVITFYIIFLVVVIFFHTKDTSKSMDIRKNHKNEYITNKKSNNKQIDFSNQVLINVIQLASQHALASPKIIAPFVKESPEMVLAYLKEMEKKGLVVYNSKGKEPDIDTSFFIAFNDNAWNQIKIEPR